MVSDKLTRVTGNESLRKYFDSEYMGAYSINPGAEPVVTIDSVLYGKITLEGGRKEDHVVITFKEKNVPGMCEVKPLVLNATNQKTLEKLYGKGADVLNGKRIQFYIDPQVKAIGGGTTEGVRIRPRVPKEEETIPLPPCADCGQEIQPAYGMDARYIYNRNMQKYNLPLCANCSAKRKEAAKNGETSPGSDQ